MKTLLLICTALICAATAHAQEVRLDSLWAKFGGVGAMSFSPDSKTLLLAEPQKLVGGSGTIRLYVPQSGIEKGNIPGTSYTSVDYTPDGKYIIMGCTDGTVKLYDVVTLELYKAIPCIYGGYFAFSPDGTKAALASEKYIAIVDLVSESFQLVITRPEKYNTSPNMSEPYFNGKVCFSTDGKYIIGKYGNVLVRWDWRNAPDKPEELIPFFPNRAILGFSPDRKYLVQQSNYLWDIEEKKQVPVEGIGDYESETAYGFAATLGGSCLVVTGKTDHTPRFINLAAQRIFSITPLKYTLRMALSPDSSFFAYQYGNGQTHLHKVFWNTTGITESSERLPISIEVQPQPGNSILYVIVQSNMDIPHCTVSMLNNVGLSARDIYNGNVTNDRQTFSIETNALPSGTYFIRARYGKNEVSQRVIITK